MNPVSQVQVASPPIIVLVGCPGDPLVIEGGGPQETVNKDIYYLGNCTQRTQTV